jgi:hypothetical protein
MLVVQKIIIRKPRAVPRHSLDLLNALSILHTRTHINRAALRSQDQNHSFARLISPSMAIFLLLVKQPQKFTSTHTTRQIYLARSWQIGMHSSN